ncbi:hypothetical protein A3Q56_04096, partial [Intoshia linei]
VLIRSHSHECVFKTENYNQKSKIIENDNKNIENYYKFISKQFSVIRLLKNLEKKESLDLFELIEYLVKSGERITVMIRDSNDFELAEDYIELRNSEFELVGDVAKKLLYKSEKLEDDNLNLVEQIKAKNLIIDSLQSTVMMKERNLIFLQDTCQDHHETCDKSYGKLEDVIKHFKKKIDKLEKENTSINLNLEYINKEKSNLSTQEHMLLEKYENKIVQFNISDKLSNNIKNFTNNMEEELIHNETITSETDVLKLRIKTLENNLNSCIETNTKLNNVITDIVMEKDNCRYMLKDLNDNMESIRLKLNDNQDEILACRSYNQNNEESFTTLAEDMKTNIHDVDTDCSLINLKMERYKNTMKYVDDIIRRRENDRFDMKNSTSTDDIMTDTGLGQSELNCTIDNSHKKCDFSPFQLSSSASVNEKLRLVKKMEGSNILKKWQDLSKPSFSRLLGIVLIVSEPINKNIMTSASIIFKRNSKYKASPREDDRNKLRIARKPSLTLSEENCSKSDNLFHLIKNRKNFPPKFK